MRRAGRARPARARPRRSSRAARWRSRTSSSTGSSQFGAKFCRSSTAASSRCSTASSSCSSRARRGPRVARSRAARQGLTRASREVFVRATRVRMREATRRRAARSVLDGVHDQEDQSLFRLLAARDPARARRDRDRHPILIGTAAGCQSAAPPTATSTSCTTGGICVSLSDLPTRRS